MHLRLQDSQKSGGISRTDQACVVPPSLARGTEPAHAPRSRRDWRWVLPQISPPGKPGKWPFPTQNAAIAVSGQSHLRGPARTEPLHILSKPELENQHP